MADILDFRPTEGRSDKRRSNSAGAGCEIVIFPGVRYERWESSAPTARENRGARKRVKRDTLELTD